MSSLTDNYFALFDLPQCFRLDIAELDLAYRAVQSRIHPDRFARASDTEKRIAMQWATFVNLAFQTLRDPVKRASYILTLHGIDVSTLDDASMSRDFLIQQMRCHEEIEDAVGASDFVELNLLAKRLSADRSAKIDKLGDWIDSGNWKPAVEAIRQLMFISRAQQDIVQRIEELENI
ncbi:Fe-S protein assembly co-chaperone HscB [Candidatus Pandoraea novymonadis]|uniref:Co-chaperone protein HscB homolog n=1 Tax=Candidatus Pandoraea novymonadis TaxID=1808959 RepID=A0ABX5FGF2_9BURK|nr:Fe-S protein assembly co-chaperone HscB [Candidatus Pandoraea novymonadis]PSB92072.1 hypothetical protein BZL35_00298 [Candidatus Pandoraea novymonadis]